MKNIIFLIVVIVFVSFESKAFVPKSNTTISVVLDSVKVGFEKDTIKILEGDSIWIAIEAMGVIPKDSTIEIRYTVKDADAQVGKDFKLRSNSNFTFRTTTATLQRQSFELLTVKDNNEEREYIVLELAIVKGEKFAKLTKKSCLILLKDYKTPAEIAQEKYREENQTALKKIQAIINADKDTGEVIGKLKLKNTKVGKYAKYILKDTIDPTKVAKAKGIMDSSFFTSTKTQGKRDSIKIDTVEILFKYGVAAEIKVHASDSETYSNLWYNGPKSRTRVGISFRHQIYKDRYHNFYLIGKNNEKSAIKLLDLLDYHATSGLNYTPADTLVGLSPKNSAYNVSVKTSLKSYIHLNFYSDLLGLLGTDPSNGLVQTEASAKIFLRTLPNNKRINFMLHYLSPYLKYSRFENGFRDVVATADVKTKKGADSLYSIDRMLVNQRKFLDIGLKMNLFEHIGRFYNTAELNILCNFGWFNRRGGKDSLNSLRTGITQFESVPHNTLDLGIEGRYSIFQYRNFGINLGAMVFFQKIWNNKLSTFTNSGYEAFYRTEAELFYFPVANSKDKIFLRTYHVMNNNPKEANFMQLQLGYKLQFKLPNKK